MMRKLLIIAAAFCFAVPASAQQNSPINSIGMLPDGSNGAAQTSRLNLHIHNNVTPEDYGAKGDGTTDDTTAINNMFTAALANGYSVTFMHRTYKVTSQISVDISTSAANLVSDGLKIIMADGGADLDGRTITSTPTLRIICTAATCTNLWMHGRLTVKGSSTAGSVFNLGLVNLTDAFNFATVDYVICQNFDATQAVAASGCKIGQVGGGSRLNLKSYIVNGNDGITGSTGSGVELVQVTQSAVEIQANQGGALAAGSALLISGATKGAAISGFSGTAGAGTCIKINSANAQYNSFIAPNFAGCANDINASAGTNNNFLNPAFSATNYVAAGSVGVGTLVPGKFTIQQPLAGDDILKLNNSDGTIAIDAQTDSNRHLIWTWNGAGALRGNISTFYSSVITNADFATSGGLQVGGTASTSLGNGGFGIKAYPATNGNIALAGATSGQVALIVPATAGTSIITLPAVTDTMVGKATTDTLTNKTLTDSINQDVTISSSQLSDTSGTLADVPGLTLTLTAAGKYKCDGHLTITSSSASGGAKMALTAVTLTATSASFTAANYNGITANARSTSTTLGAAIGGATAAVTDINFVGGIVVGTGGTLKVQAAENAAFATPTVFGTNSTFACHRSA